jgi:hypothetical protein
MGDLDAVVVAIDNGLLIAGAGERSICEALGAIAPLLGSRGFNGRIPAALEGQSVDVCPVFLEGETVYVASAGRQGGDPWLTESIEGVRRILGYGPPPESQLLVN